MKRIEEIWYLLFDGVSEDGRGWPEYCGRTTDVLEAKAHYEKCARDPYSIGTVQIVGDRRANYADRHTQWPV